MKKFIKKLYRRRAPARSRGQARSLFQPGVGPDGGSAEVLELDPSAPPLVAKADYPCRHRYRYRRDKTASSRDIVTAAGQANDSGGLGAA